MEDFIDLGIDFPTYPQLFDMGKQFLDDLVGQDCGIVMQDGKYRLKEKRIEEVSPPGLEPFFWTLQYLREQNISKGVRLKAAITGPFTLASYIEMKTGTYPFSTALSDLAVVRQLSDVVSKSCDVASREASMVSIDEPVLGVIVGAKIPFGCSESDIVQIYNRLEKACHGRFVGTHICGRISPKLASILLQTDLDFLSHEFHDSPVNSKLYDPVEVKKSDKVLSVGCLSSRNPRVEAVEEILGIMKEFRKYGEDLIFTPDCGFRPLTANGSKEEGYNISIRKLRNLVDAAGIFKEK